jgi:hypothetical protein
VLQVEAALQALPAAGEEPAEEELSGDVENGPAAPIPLCKLPTTTEVIT